MMADNDKHINTLLDNYQQLSIEIDAKRIEHKQRVFERTAQWLNNITAISFGIGGVIIPLLLINQNELRENIWILTLSSLLLITNGLIIMIKTKEGIETDSRQVDSMGYLHQAAMKERTSLVESARKGEIDGEEFQFRWNQSDDELKSSNEKLQSRSEGISYWMDLHMGILLICILMVPYAMFSILYWPLLMIATAIILAIFAKSVIKSKNEIEKARSKKKEYLARIKL